jgi:UDP-GlcNAc:undecaprenyl-phosphate GlcNAc-1-phosphate transferase
LIKTPGVDWSKEIFFPYIAFLVYFMLAILFSLLTNGLLLRFSQTLGNRHEQNGHSLRWSHIVKPSVGGFSFYILFLMSLSVHGIFNTSESEYINTHLLGMVFCVTLGFLIGLADDAYNTYPWLKLSGQLLCGIFLVATDTLIPATGIYIVDALLTLIWVVGIMNSINMLDNMDGISGTVSLFILFACLLVLGVEGNFFSFYSLMLLGVTGAVVGFLWFNWHPARIYMGDTGSQFLGAFLAAVSIQVLWKYHDAGEPAIQFRQFLIPLIAFSVPLADTTTVFIRRLARGQSPFVGGKDHISHHFAYIGLSDKQVIFLLGGWSLVSAGFTAVLVFFRHELNTWTIALAYGYFIVPFFIVQYFYNKGKKKESQSNDLPELLSADYAKRFTPMHKEEMN